jgi:hypothetical protein
MRQWRSSGLSVRAFCAEHGLAAPSFYWWRRALGEKNAEAVHFAPVRVVSDPRPQPTADGLTADLELVLGGGRRLRIGAGFDGPTLQRLLALLEEGRL